MRYRFTSRSSRLRDGFLRGGVAFGLVPPAVILFVGPTDLRLRDDAVAADADEVVEAPEAFVSVLLEKARQTLIERLDDRGADRMIEHRGSAHLDRSAAEQEVIQRVREGGDPADSREALVRKRLRELRHLRQ